MDFEGCQYINPGQLLESVGNDCAAWSSLLRIYLDTAPPIFERLEQAAAAGKSASVQKESHTLKGMSALIGAQVLAAMLLQIERQAREGHLPAPHELSELKQQLGLATAELMQCLQASVLL